jgi:hypothetical protein
LSVKVSMCGKTNGFFSRPQLAFPGGNDWARQREKMPLIRRSLFAGGIDRRTRRIMAVERHRNPQR